MATRWQLCVCSLGILLLAPCSLSEKFSLAGSPHPVVGVVGQDVVLPCQLSPPARLPSMDVQWRKIGSGFVQVHEYSDEGPQDVPGESYQNRTELFLREFSSGNVSLKLKGLQVTDDGKYQCFVRNPEWSREATTDLRVRAVAPVFIDVLGFWGQGIGLACRSAGWFPKPELQWVGKNLAMEIVTNVTQDRENLYSVVSHVTVTEGEDNGDISCIVRNGLLETEQRSAIHLSGHAQTSQVYRGSSQQSDFRHRPQSLASSSVKDGEEISSQMGLEDKFTYGYNHTVSSGSSGNYACVYEMKNSDKRVTKSHLSPAKHLSVTSSASSRGGGEEPTRTGPTMSLIIWAARCALVLLLLVSAPVITFVLEKRGLPEPAGLEDTHVEAS
ncbi:hypothetical protein KIL84_001690 [Mauremys mutica]|uniref:Ig-like domain-containing protein n=1 Tax=Mauremys mutica TaxID=74926 RepID=A0A9D3XJL1_9SAUR|nr:hypothetical protein KIL84_001690 [Mauremys mutica]